MLAVEKDYALAEKLEKDFAENEAFRIIQGDILRLNFSDCIEHARSLKNTSGPERIKVVANLPYYITTDLLKQLLPQGDFIECLALLLQDEVAQRLTCEHPGLLIASCIVWCVISHGGMFLTMHCLQMLDHIEQCVYFPIFILIQDTCSKLTDHASTQCLRFMGLSPFSNCADHSNCLKCVMTESLPSS